MNSSKRKIHPAPPILKHNATAAGACKIIQSSSAPKFILQPLEADEEEATEVMPTASCDFSESAALSALTAARAAARRLGVASGPSGPPLLVLVLLGAGLGAGPCIVVFVRENCADRCQRVSQKSSNDGSQALLYWSS